MPKIITYQQFCDFNLYITRKRLFEERQQKMCRFFRVKAEKSPAYADVFIRCICGERIHIQNGFFVDMLSVSQWEVFEGVQCIEKFALPIPLIRPFEEMTYEQMDYALAILGRDILTPPQCCESSNISSVNEFVASDSSDITNDCDYAPMQNESLYYSTSNETQTIGAQQQQIIEETQDCECIESDCSDMNDSFIVVSLPQQYQCPPVEDNQVCMCNIVCGNVKCGHRKGEYDFVTWQELLFDSMGPNKETPLAEAEVYKCFDTNRVILRTIKCKTD